MIYQASVGKLFCPGAFNLQALNVQAFGFHVSFLHFQTSSRVSCPGLFRCLVMEKKSELCNFLYIMEKCKYLLVLYDPSHVIHLFIVSLFYICLGLSTMPCT